jgi:hypothetical protein
MSVSAFTQNVSRPFSQVYCTVEGRLAFQQEAKNRELRKRQHLACALASGEKMLVEGFIALERSVHHVTMLTEMVSELNLSGQMHVMTWGDEMLADGFHTLRKITQRVKGIEEIVHTLKIQESDMIAHDEEMLVDEFNALQRDYLHVKELEEIVHQINIQDHAIQQEPLEDLRVNVDSVPPVNKKRKFFTQQEAQKLFEEKERLRESARMRMRRNKAEVNPDVEPKMNHHPASSVNKKRTFFTQEEAEKLFEEKERGREYAKIRMKKKREGVMHILNSLSDDAKIKRATIEKELANEVTQECAKVCPEEKKKIRIKRNSEKIDRIIKRLSDDDMMTAVLQSLGHTNTIGVDLLSAYTLWLFTATKYSKNGRLMTRLALMKAFVVEYFSR